jgi:hypothetical protein
LLRSSAWLRRRERELEVRAAAEPAPGVDLAAVGLDDRAADREA